MTKQFYFKENTIIFNDCATVDFFDTVNHEILTLRGIVNFDLRLIGGEIKNFINKLLSLVLSMNVKGVVMYVSEELDYLSKSYKDDDFDLYNNNPIVIFDSPKKVDVVFFNGINEISINEIKEKLFHYKNKEVIFNFNNLDITTLKNFIPTFIGWIVNSELKKISFASHFGEIKNVLDKSGLFCMVNVSNLISFPKKKSNSFYEVKNKKINKFLSFANYGALQF